MNPLPPCICGHVVRDPATQPGYDGHCGICGEDVKVRRGALCPITPLYCDNHGPHRCFNDEEWRGGIVLVAAG